MEPTIHPRGLVTGSALIVNRQVHGLRKRGVVLRHVDLVVAVGEARWDAYVEFVESHEGASEARVRKRCGRRCEGECDRVDERVGLLDDYARKYGRSHKPKPEAKSLGVDKTS